MKQVRISLVVLVLLASVTTIQGCGKEEHKKAASQVAAKVNGDEVSVHQINFLLSKARGVTAENAETAKREVLDKLIDQQLAIQQAEAAKLDRNPEVMQSIEAARRDILARAYLEQVATAQRNVSTDDAKSYYREHPELFSERRIYNLQELMVPADATSLVQELLAKGTSMLDMANALKAKDIKFAANAGVRPAEQLPLNVVSRIHSLKDGQTAVIENPQGAMVVHIVSSQTQPVAENDALPRIQQFLGNQRGSEAVANELKSLRGKAQIEKLGEFAAAAASPVSAADPAPTTSSMVTAPAPASTEASPNEQPTGAIDASSVSKGVAGLK